MVGLESNFIVSGKAKDVLPQTTSHSHAYMHISAKSRAHAHKEVSQNVQRALFVIAKNWGENDY